MNSLLHEVSVGNLLYYRNIYKPVEVQDLVNIQNGDTGYRRINLNDELLERSGFFYNYYMNGVLYKVNASYNIGISSSSVIQIVENKGIIIPNLKLEYLHDLQNYIYANFRSRLQITL